MFGCGCAGLASGRVSMIMGSSEWEEYGDVLGMIELAWFKEGG